MSSEEWGTGVAFLGPFPLPDARRFLPSPPGVRRPGPSPQSPCQALLPSVPLNVLLSRQRPAPEAAREGDSCVALAG